MSEPRPAFGRDSKRELAVGEYLDEHLYPNEFASFERIHDKERQLQGIDVVARHSSIEGELLIDEKAATSWAHKGDLKTFAFELSSMYGNREMGGWFLDLESRNQTTHWLCVWPRTDGAPIKNSTDISHAEAILVSVRKLRNWVRRHSSKDSGYIEDAISLLRDGAVNQVKWSGLRVMISRQLPEKPINLLIPRDIIRELGGGLVWKLTP